MTRTTLRIALFIVFAALMANPSQAADVPQPTAEQVRDDAISKTTAWRPKSAETILNKNLNYEKSQPWLTAEALLMATFGIGQDEDTVKEALAILDKQAKKNPKDPVSEFYRGEVLYWGKEPNKAKAAWKNANDRAATLTKKDPKDGCAQYYLGASFVRLVKPQEARKALIKAKKADFDPSMVDFQKGLSYFLERNWKSARDSFDAVYELDPRFAHLFFYRALAWEKLGQKDNYLVDLEQFVKLAPNSPEAKTAMALLSARK